jgi:hypothetical protein
MAVTGVWHNDGILVHGNRVKKYVTNR